MEFRDVLGAVTASIAIATFATNWLRARGFERTRQMRDELTKFTSDDVATERIKPEIMRSAADASLVLSLELAEMSRRVAAKNAKKSTTTNRKIATVIGATLAAAVLFLWSALAASRAEPVSYWLGVSYFVAMSAIAIAACILYVRERLTIRRATSHLGELRRAVSNSKPLTDTDLKKSASDHLAGR